METMFVPPVHRAATGRVALRHTYPSPDRRVADRGQVMTQGLVTESWGVVQVRQFAEDEQALKLALNEAVGGHLEMVSGPTWRMYINGHGWRLSLPVNLIATLLKARLG